MGDIGSAKRKHNSLSIAKKVELLQRLDRGASVRRVSEEFGVGISTIYDVKNQKEQIMKFYAESDVQNEMNKRKTMHKPKIDELDRVMMEWWRQRRSEKILLSGPMVMQQAKIFHAGLEIETPCEYSSGWLTKFKRHYGIRQLKVCGEKASAGHEATESYIDELVKLIADENFLAEQFYNADKTALFWCCIPRKILATAEEMQPADVKDINDRLIVLACANATGTHKCKLMVIGKSQHPRCFKGVRIFSAHYYANKKAWVTRVIFLNWFGKHFVPQVRAHCMAAGLDENCKIFLLRDNCSAHPDAELLVKANVRGIYLPPKITSLVDPMDQGILRSMKCLYKNELTRRLLNAVNRDIGITMFSKDFFEGRHMGSCGCME
uniref:jerky protein homolog n=1 Tax=Pristiophorus japonicus TaxID=55135 RepID=UPI00398EA6BC